MGPMGGAPRRAPRRTPRRAPRLAGRMARHRHQPLAGFGAHGEEEGNNRAVYDFQCSTFFNILQHVEFYLVRMILDDDLCSFHAG